jgi:hypothetical protein
MICCLESENPDTNHKKRRETEKFKLVISSKISTRFSRQHSQRFFSPSQSANLPEMDQGSKAWLEAISSGAPPCSDSFQLRTGFQDPQANPTQIRSRYTVSVRFPVGTP